MLLLLGLGFLLLNCGSVRILKLEKYKILPGAPTGAPFFRYIIDIKTYNKIKFLSINIGDNITKERFSVINIKTNMQSDNQSSYHQGSYRLQFDTPFTKLLENSQDIIKITYRNNGDLKTILKTTDTFKVLQLR